MEAGHDNVVMCYVYADVPILPSANKPILWNFAEAAAALKHDVPHFPRMQVGSISLAQACHTFYDPLAVVASCLLDNKDVLIGRANITLTNQSEPVRGYSILQPASEGKTVLILEDVPFDPETCDEAALWSDMCEIDQFVVSPGTELVIPQTSPIARLMKRSLCENYAAGSSNNAFHSIFRPSGDDLIASPDMVEAHRRALLEHSKIDVAEGSVPQTRCLTGKHLLQSLQLRFPRVGDRIKGLSVGERANARNLTYYLSFVVVLKMYLTPAGNST